MRFRDKRCSECEFFAEYEKTDGFKILRGPYTGECRVLPPVAHPMDPSAIFPFVRKNDWCCYHKEVENEV
jgi:hypothetical protein